MPTDSYEQHLGQALADVSKREEAIWILPKTVADSIDRQSIILMLRFYRKLRRLYLPDSIAKHIVESLFLIVCVGVAIPIVIVAVIAAFLWWISSIPARIKEKLTLRRNKSV